jgi:hypothetical protein
MATGPAAGTVSIGVDSGTVPTVDLYATTAGQRKLVFGTAALSATAAHTVTVSPAGTKNAASTGTRVDLDGLTWSRRRATPEEAQRELRRTPCIS